jgi:competence CoiA-like predicted nuclease
VGDYMRIAIYNGSIINALDTKNKYGHYINSIYNEYKMAGQNGLLFCPDCKTKVILRAGNIREPYFAHVDSERKCEYNIEKGKSNEQIKGESILYYWLNEQYKEHVFIDKKYNNRFSNVSLEYKGKIYAFNYIRNERVLNEWNKKRKDYFETGIIDLYFFSFKEFDELKNSEIQFKKTVQQYTKDNTIKMIDTDNKKLILMRFIEFFDDEDNLFYSKLSLREYNIYDVKFTLDGQLVTNFEEEYSIDYKQHEEIANNILI